MLSVGRIESIKRVDLAVQALSARGSAAPARRRRRRAASRPRRCGLLTRRAWRIASSSSGAIDDDRLLELYADALAVVYAPFDEDYGYVTLEAFLAAKPVVTTADAGGPLEFVVDEVNGLVCEPVPEALAERPSGASPRIAPRPRDWARRGASRARDITWDGVIEKLVSA